MSSYKEFMRRKQLRDFKGEAEAENQLMVAPMASAPWQSMRSVFDGGEGVYAPLQAELSRHGLNARCDRPRLGSHRASTEIPLRRNPFPNQSRRTRTSTRPRMPHHPYRPRHLCRPLPHQM